MNVRILHFIYTCNLYHVLVEEKINILFYLKTGIFAAAGCSNYEVSFSFWPA
jgi:hypothetical protein